MRFLRGDTDADGELLLTDGIVLLQYLFFLGMDAPSCADGADSDDDGSLTLTDAIFLLQHLFLQGPAPGGEPGQCVRDRTGDDLDCRTPSARCGDL